MIDTYFTWPDRGLRYECRGCGACCKGLGIGLDVAAGQLVQLVTKRPELAAFVRRRGDAITAFNPRDRCWFLADDGLCRIETEDGRAAKPASCRLFPFNRVFHIGTTMVVDFNSVICPLQLAPAGDGVAHADIAAEIRTIQDPAITGTSLPADADLERERTIAAVVFGGGDADRAWRAQGEGEMTVAGFELLTGLPWRLPDGATLANALAVTPSLRFNELYGPRQYRARAKMQPVLARMWLGWLGFARLGAELAQRALGMQELTTLWAEQASVMHALARWDDAPYLKPGPIDLTSEPLVKLLAQRCVDNKQKRRPLGELVAAVIGGAPVTQRITAIKLAETILKTALG
ncbi:MAG: YkgJ family cysteine cluster protein [Deltaproteobacteria bacterium]